MQHGEGENGAGSQPDDHVVFFQQRVCLAGRQVGSLATPYNSGFIFQKQKPERRGGEKASACRILPSRWRVEWEKMIARGVVPFSPIIPSPAIRKILR